MNFSRTLAVAGPVLRQLLHDPRSLALMLFAPPLLVGLFAWFFNDIEGVFDRLGGPILALFPFILMFVVTSVTTLRERRSGTLERLMTTPLGKADFIVGYALGLLASVFARTEFQAVQHMPIVVIPQILLVGLLMPRDSMPDALHAISDWLPLSYAVDAVNAVTADGLGKPLIVIAAVTLASLALTAVTLRRRTP